MIRNIYVSVAGAVGLILLFTVVLDWVSYTDFLASLIWKKSIVQRYLYRLGELVRDNRPGWLVVSSMAAVLVFGLAFVVAMDRKSVGQT